MHLNFIHPTVRSIQSLWSYQQFLLICHETQLASKIFPPFIRSQAKFSANTQPLVFMDLQDEALVLILQNPDAGSPKLVVYEITPARAPRVNSHTPPLPDLCHPRNSFRARLYCIIITSVCHWWKTAVAHSVCASVLMSEAWPRTVKMTQMQGREGITPTYVPSQQGTTKAEALCAA